MITQNRPASPMLSRRRVTTKNSNGFALVIVLAIIVLLVVLVVGFMSSAGTERSAAHGFHSSVVTRQLADTAVNIVQGQINMASTQGQSVAWASQPGMLRTFSSAENGPLTRAYKLYSAVEMISDKVNLVADMPPGSWANDTAIWTDLNAPVEVDGARHYPVLDPSSLDLPGETPLGFSIDSAPGATSYQKAPMPVRWLYLLKDGRLIAPSNITGTTATISGASGQNPIVGRIAFWTDDDTCKVNINTSSDGTYWDTPRTLSSYEVSNLAPNQPAYREFQRYPGHPAMTSLKAVFPALSSAQIYSIVPRVSEGGSMGGTVNSYNATAVTPDSDRLYSNIEELVFRPDHQSQNAGLSPQQVKRSGFFLSARSRAPETNLFNLPRIACWPIYKMATDGSPDLTRTTVSDRLLAFCSSTGELGTSTFHPYIFQRENPLSASNDINIARNLQLYTYLRHLTDTAVPGFGGNFSSKFGLDRDQLLTEIFDYIRCVNLRDSSLQNWDATASTAFATTGFVVPTKHTTPTGETMGFGRYYTLSEFGIAFICNASGDEPSSNIPTGAGANKVLGGTALAPGERYIQAIIAPEFFSPSQGFIGINTSFYLDGIQKKTETPFSVTISGLDSLFVNGTTALFPPIPNTSYARYDSTESISSMLPFGGSPNYRFFAVSQNSPKRGNLDDDGLASYPFGNGQYPFIGTPVKVALPSGVNDMSFSGGTLTVNIHSAVPPTPQNIIQSIPITLPGGTIPIPKLAMTGTNGSPDPAAENPTTSMQNWWAFSSKGAIAGYEGRLSFLHWLSGGAGRLFRTEYDTIRTVYPSHGDYRLGAASPTGGGASFFDRQPKTIGQTAASFSGEYGLATELPDVDRSGRLVPGANYSSGSIPDFPSEYEGNTHGDFDTGVANLADGPFINKSDEGDLSLVAGAAGAYFASTRGWYWTKAVGTTLFSPNRQMPSAGMFGSLSTGVKRQRPWETLLFRPQEDHPNHDKTIPDHLIMDLFWMPIVEPYAISDRFSTAGKINMNQQILPFTYITRETGLHAVLLSERMAVIPTSEAGVYKGGGYAPAAPFQSRLSIDIPETLKQFKAKFSAGEIYKSASEICDIHIVPQGSSLSALQGSFWTTNALTGDNLREKIYATLYPRLTTKSNTYTVHFKVQALKKLPPSSGIPQDIWTEGRDVIAGEYRGSTSIERFVDANNKNILDYAADPAAIGTTSSPSLDTYYRWRTIENRQFSP